MLKKINQVIKNMAREKFTNEKCNEEIDYTSIPRHVAIIMDGNGRWAKKRGLPRVSGHKEGMNAVKRVTRAAANTGIEVLTVYAFSTENWKRPEEEVQFLMKLPSDFFQNFVPELVEKNIRVMSIGDISELPQHTRDALDRACEQTKDNTGMILNFALNYGAQDEICKAVQKIALDVKENRIEPADITNEIIEHNLMTSDLPAVDLLIRTSGEMRISNFLLWQIAYSELIFLDILWPDVSEENFMEMILAYQKRHRRFGGL